MKLRGFPFLTWKKLLVYLSAWVAAVLLHNFVYGLFKGHFDRHGGDEPFFFILAIFVIPALFLASVAATVVRFIRRRRASR